MEIEMIHTTRGDVASDKMDIKVIEEDNENETIFAKEYRMRGEDEIIRRDVHVQLKKNVFSEGFGAEF